MEQEKPVIIPEWVLSMRPAAIANLKKVAKDVHLVAVGQTEIEMVWKEMYSCRLNRRQCYAHIVYAQYQDKEDFHISIHIPKTLENE